MNEVFARSIYPSTPNGITERVRLGKIVVTSTEPPAATLSTRCQPRRRPLPVFESGPIPAFAATVTLCVLQAKLVDERTDERGLRAVGSRLLAALSRPRFDRAQAILVASGFPMNDARHQLDLQASIEARVASGLAPAATGRAFGAILAHTARLAGKNGNAAPLYRVGYSLGALGYTLDAYQDFHADGRRGRFNYLAALAGPSQADNLRQVRRLAREVAFERLRQIRQAWQGVELLHYRSVLEAVLLTGLSARTERVLAPGSGRSLTDGYEEQKDDVESNSASHSTDCCEGGSACFCPSGDYGGCCYCCDCIHCCNQGADSGCCDCSGCDCGGCDCDNCDFRQLRLQWLRLQLLRQAIASPCRARASRWCDLRSLLK
jgi:hypothetical protein